MVRITIDEMYDCAERVALEERSKGKDENRSRREVAEAMLAVITKRRDKCRKTA